MEELPVVQSTFEPSGPPRLRAECPHCQEEGLYTIDLQIHSNVPGAFPVKCDNCGEEFRVDPSSTVNPDVQDTK